MGDDDKLKGQQAPLGTPRVQITSVEKGQWQIMQTRVVHEGGGTP